jgi:excisionase family DNA binding protein
MTNDTIDQDVGVTQAAVVRLLGYAAVRPVDAAGMRIMRTPYLGTHGRVVESGCFPHRNDRRQTIPTLRGGKHPPLGCPTNDVTAWGEGMERLLSINEAAKLLGTTMRFPRQLVAEHRIRFVQVGRHVRIPHDLRHTGQTLATATGATLADLKKRLGHLSSAAAQHYMHAIEGRDLEIARPSQGLPHIGCRLRLLSRQAVPTTSKGHLPARANCASLLQRDRRQR